MVYLDNAATTFPKPECVYLEMDKTNRCYAVNAGRGSYKLARKASAIISETKKMMRELIHADISADVIFSPSITVAFNQIIKGIEIKESSIIYISPYEHNAVARTIHMLEKMDKKVTVKLLPVNEITYEIDIDKMKYEFSKDKPDFVFCTHISNVIGYILPIEEIFDAAKNYNSITVLDTAQSLGLLPVDVKKINVDIIAFAGHKTLYGPFGIGGFINITGVPINTVITGGTGSNSLDLDMPEDSEGKYEAASCNIVAVAGLKAALTVLDQKANYEKEKILGDYLISQLNGLNKVKMFLPGNIKNHISIVSFIYDGITSEDVGMILDEDFDIAVRTGYHCSPFIHSIIKDEKSLGTVRIGIGQYTTKEDIDLLIEALKHLED